MTDYKPLDLGPIREVFDVEVDEDGLYDAVDYSERLTKDLSNLMETSSYIPSLLAEVVRLRREVAMEHQRRGYRARSGPWATMERDRCWSGGSVREQACPTCQAASLDDWDPSKPIDWKPEEKA